jgi:hypothetical protein
MSDAPQQPSPTPNFVLRYRVRTLLTVTVVVAILAAIAGPYWRRQTPEVRISLLGYWALLAACSCGSLWLRLRNAFSLQRDREGKQRIVRMIVTQWGFRHMRPSLQWAGLAVTVLFALFYTAIASRSVVVQLQGRLPTRSWIFWQTNLSLVYVPALLFGLAAWFFLPRPVFLCEEGIPLSQTVFVPWRYIRSAEWRRGRPGSLKLHRLDGDLYFEVPADQRAAVEEFLRTKSAWIATDEASREVDSTASPD